MTPDDYNPDLPPDQQAPSGQPNPYSPTYPGTLQDNPAADPNGPGSPLWNSVVQMFVSATGKYPSSDDIVRQAIRNFGGNVGEIQKSIYASPEAQAWGARNPYTFDPKTGIDVPKDPSVTPPDQWSIDHPFGANITPPAADPSKNTSGGSSGGGGGGGGTGVNTLPNPFDTPFVAPDRLAMPTAPTFNAPALRTPPPFQGLAPFTPAQWSDVAPAPFKAPTMAEVLADPGYQLPLQQGLGALTASRAAQGLWATGATGKALNDYAQNYANTFYGNIYNRDASTYGMNWDNQYKGFTTDVANAADAWKTNEGQLVDTYNTNYKTQYQDPYTNEYTAAVDAFKPQILQYTTDAANTQHENDTNWTNAYNLWDTLFSHKYKTAGFLNDVAAE